MVAESRLASNPAEALIMAIATFTQTKENRLEKELSSVYYSLSESIDLAREELRISGDTAYIYSVAFSPDGTKIVSASEDGTAKVWDLSGKELAQFTGHTGTVSSVAFSPGFPPEQLRTGIKEAFYWSEEKNKSTK